MRGLCTLNILLTIRDFSVLVTKDVNGAILNIVKNSYEHKCYQMKYIHSVNRILFRSNIEANQFDLCGSFNTNVVIEADCEYFVYQEALFDMKVIKKTDIAVLKKDNAIALIRLVDGVDVVEGEMYPIKIGKATMDVGNELIKINAIPFVPTPVSIVLKLSANKQSKPDAVNSLNLAMVNYLNARSKISNMEIFTKMATPLYPYKDKCELPCIASTNVSIESLVDKFRSSDSGKKFDGMMLYSGDKTCIDVRKTWKIPVIKKIDNDCNEVVEICSIAEGLTKICVVETMWIMEVVNAIEFKLIEKTNVMQLYDKYRK